MSELLPLLFQLVNDNGYHVENSDNGLKDSMKHSRKTKTGREVFLDQYGKISHNQYVISDEKFHHTAVTIFHGLQNWKHKCSGTEEYLEKFQSLC